MTNVLKTWVQNHHSFINSFQYINKTSISFWPNNLKPHLILFQNWEGIKKGEKQKNGKLKTENGKKNPIIELLFGEGGYWVEPVE